jgi:hypothetical protein
MIDISYVILTSNVSLTLYLYEKKAVAELANLLFDDHFVIGDFPENFLRHCNLNQSGGGL